MHPPSLPGLTCEEVRKALQKFGQNVMPEKHKTLVGRVGRWLVSPMSILFIIAGALTYLAHNVTDMSIILVLFVINLGVGVWHEQKADNTIRELRNKLAVTVKVYRDKKWQRIASQGIVPGDLIELNNGDLIPADVKFVYSVNLSINEASVTGESLPKEKIQGDTGYSGTYVATGTCQATVTSTGAKTYFGKTLSMIDTSHHRSLLEKDIVYISTFLAVVSIVLIVILTTVLLAAGSPLIEVMTLDISLLIAGIPVALPTVMTLIISVGVVTLARKSVVVRRLSSLEDLANVNLLLSDKTGTLTENRIRVKGVTVLDSHIRIGGSSSHEAIWALALTCSPQVEESPIDAAINAGVTDFRLPTVKVSQFIPGDSERKRATAQIELDGHKRTVSFGAPMTIAGLCTFGRGSIHSNSSIGSDQYERYVCNTKARMTPLPKQK